MLHQFKFAVEFFVWLDGLDRRLAGWVAQLGSPKPVVPGLRRQLCLRSYHGEQRGVLRTALENRKDLDAVEADGTKKTC